MKKILTILLLAVSVAAWGTKWYISPTGNDTSGDGTTRGYLPDMGAYEIEDIRMLINSTGDLILNNNKRVTIRR